MGTAIATTEKLNSKLADRLSALHAQRRRAEGVGLLDLDLDQITCAGIDDCACVFEKNNEFAQDLLFA